MEELKIKRKWTWPPHLPKWSRRERLNFRTGMLFLLPWTIGFLAFTLYPMVASFFYSFTIYHPRMPNEWIGLQNYVELLHDKLFWQSLYNTLYMVAIGVPLTLLASFFCAVLLNLKVRGQSIYRVIYFLPSIVPTVASTILWLWILNPQTGILNTLLGYIGIQGPNWMSNPNWSCWECGAWAARLSFTSLACRTCPSACWKLLNWMERVGGNACGTSQSQWFHRLRCLT